MRERPFRRWGILALAALWSAPVAAEPALPPPDAVAAALDAAPAVIAAEARTDAARAEARALARGTQEFSLTTGFMSRSIDREGRYNEYDAVLSRPIRLPGKGQLDRAAGEFGLSVARNRAEDARHQTALLLADSWWDWVAAAAEVRVNRQAAENYRGMLAAVRRRVALRDAAALEADQTEAALGGALLALEQAEGRMAVARARLAARFPSLPLPDAAPEPDAPELPGEGLAPFGAKVVARSHEIAAADAEAQRVATLAERARADRLADPSLGVRLFSERGGLERGAGVVVTLPLGGGHRRALADRASAEASAAQADAAAARQVVNEMATADMTLAEAGYAAWRRAREGLDAQVAALMKLRRGQAAGEFGLAEVLLGERQVHDAFRAEALARIEAQRALTRLRIDSHELWITE
ncbi:TolC family protein [Novosphingobium piscinae]|uniref:TolC family protein n=1 Tax=Novosphingobium piscinae TaxID=1507448 RepID=A0A7X1KPL5_9SPHN|nr:TolC family protein [Novosphingobium piscinae]MBC2668861.1 TolC family protein [Novosphingobium piscinae]